MALLVVVLLGMVGIALDIGRLYVARTELSRAVDAAALAGVVELPDINAAQARATAYLAENLPDATISFPATQGQNQFRVQGSRTVSTLFVGVLGFQEVTIDAQATAGFGIVPVDTVLTIDATGSMGAWPCNRAQNNPGCPIKEAKDAAQIFADILLPDTPTSNTTQVAVVPYRGCYNPPRRYARCIPGGWVHPLSSNQGLVHGKIEDIRSQGGTGTNVCLGLLRSEEILFGTNSHTEPNTLRFIVILTDGDNTYNRASYGNGAPPVDCRPNTSPWRSDRYVDSACRGAQTRERELDVKTKAMADAIKAQGVEIYVVGFGVCGSPNNDLCNPGLIGGTAHDNIADRNLLKCIASSSPGTNDHYFEVPSAQDLPDVFSQIAQEIAFRLVE
jgi:hypothetical protein